MTVFNKQERNLFTHAEVITHAKKQLIFTFSFLFIRKYISSIPADPLQRSSQININMAKNQTQDE